MLSMNYVNDTFLIVLHKSIIEVSSGCLDGMNLYVFLILSSIAFASYIRSDTSLVCHLFRKKSNHNLWQGEQQYWNWARCLPKWGTLLAPNE